MTLFSSSLLTPLAAAQEGRLKFCGTKLYARECTFMNMQKMGAAALKVPAVATLPLCDQCKPFRGGGAQWGLSLQRRTAHIVSTRPLLSPAPFSLPPLLSPVSMPMRRGCQLNLAPRPPLKVEDLFDALVVFSEPTWVTPKDTPVKNTRSSL